MADEHLPEPEEAPSASPFERIVALARSVLRGEGLSDYQIDALLNRPRAPQRDRLGPED